MATSRRVRVCSDCGGVMVVDWQTRENGSLYTWYRCPRKGCPGVYLQRQRLMRRQESAVDANSVTVRHAAHA
jgi:hypothetical protein